MNCPNCNHPIMPGQKFCDRCGTKVEAAVNNFDNPQAPVQAPTQVYDAAPEAAGAPTQVYEPVSREPEQPVTYGDGYAAPLSQQPNFDVQAPEQPSYAQQPYRQAPQPSEYPAQPSEYPPYEPQQYQPPYPMKQPQQGGGKPSKNSKTPLIIVIIVLAVLLVGGGVFAAIMLLNPNKDDNKGDSAATSASSVSSQTESSKASSSSKPESSRTESSESRTETSSRVESSSRTESSRTYSSREESSSAPTPSADANKLYNNNGILLADDPAIDTSDASTEAILNLSLQQGGMESQMETLNKQMGDKGSASMYVKGNTIVMEFDVTDAMTDAEKSTFGPAMEASSGQMMSSFKTLKDQYGISVNVVIALVESSGNVYYSKVYTP